MKLPDYSSARVLVVGDLMLDRYWHGNTSRISAEAPVPIVHVKNNEQRAGGAGNVALNLAALGAKVTTIGFVGQDEAAIQLRKLMETAGITCKFEELINQPTITKLRIMSRNQQLIRLDFEERFHDIDESSLLAHFKTELEQTQIVILSDYGKGTLNNIQKFITLAIKMHKPVLIDPKGTNFQRYRNASLITPNLTEFEAVVGTCETEEEIVSKGLNLLDELQLEALLITRSKQGMTLLTKDSPALHLPTHALEVFDVTGAGDTVISTLAASLAAHKTLAESTKLANLAAGSVVGKMGTATVTAEELNYAIHGSKAHYRGIGTLAEILTAIRQAQDDGEKIVLTNGCFDLLHLGHITYLKQAKALGNRLVVLVNSNASVQRLKGETRPINDLEHRMAMLAALECVDWVMSFEADTPQNMIAKLLPDILVKGGDYKDISTIVGHKEVLANGGKVEILNFVDGHSTTNIIQTIQGTVND